jgi:hypothetical protein
MKLLTIICAPVILLAALTGSALAAEFTIGTAAGTTAADCAKAGGSVTTNAQGVQVCVLPSRPRPTSSGGGAPNGREPTN